VRVEVERLTIGTSLPPLICMVVCFCQTRPKARRGLNSTIELDTLKLLFNLHLASSLELLRLEIRSCCTTEGAS
jgi:hypothetical protein